VTAARITHAAKATAVAQYIERRGGTVALDAAMYAALYKLGVSRSEIARALDHLAAHGRVAVVARGGQVFVGPVAAPAVGVGPVAAGGHEAARKGRRR